MKIVLHTTKKKCLEGEEKEMIKLGHLGQSERSPAVTNSRTRERKKHSFKSCVFYMQSPHGSQAPINASNRYVKRNLHSSKLNVGQTFFLEGTYTLFYLRRTDGKNISINLLNGSSLFIMFIRFSSNPFKPSGLADRFMICPPLWEDEAQTQEAVSAGVSMGNYYDFGDPIRLE